LNLDNVIQNFGISIFDFDTLRAWCNLFFILVLNCDRMNRYLVLRTHIYIFLCTNIVGIRVYLPSMVNNVSIWKCFNTLVFGFVSYWLRWTLV